jgi:hypothetical protein
MRPGGALTNRSPRRAEDAGVQALSGDLMVAEYAAVPASAMLPAMAAMAVRAGGSGKVAGHCTRPDDSRP